MTFKKWIKNNYGLENVRKKEYFGLIEGDLFLPVIKNHYVDTAFYPPFGDSPNYTPLEYAGRGSFEELNYYTGLKCYSPEGEEVYLPLSRYSKVQFYVLPQKGPKYREKIRKFKSTSTLLDKTIEAFLLSFEDMMSLEIGEAKKEEKNMRAYKETSWVLPLEDYKVTFKTISTKEGLLQYSLSKGSETNLMLWITPHLSYGEISYLTNTVYNIIKFNKKVENV